MAGAERQPAEDETAGYEQGEQDRPKIAVEPGVGHGTEQTGPRRCPSRSWHDSLRSSEHKSEMRPS